MTHTDSSIEQKIDDLAERLRDVADVISDIDAELLTEAKATAIDFYVQCFVGNIRTVIKQDI